MHPQSLSEITAEGIREEHLRFAVLLDQLTDAWNEAAPVHNRIAELRLEFDSHAAVEEQALETEHPRELPNHREGHDIMSGLLSRLAGESEQGTDITPTLVEIQNLFSSRIMHDDQVFLSHT